MSEQHSVTEETTDFDFELDSFEKRSSFYRGVVTAERLITGVLLAGLFALVLVQVITRYVFDSPLSWTEESARLALVWLTFMAASYVSSRRSHITVDLIASVLPRTVARGISLFAQLIVIAASAFMAVAGIMMTDIVSALALPATSLPTTLLYAGALIGFALILIHTVLDIIMMFRFPEENPDIIDAAAGLEGL